MHYMYPTTNAFQIEQLFSFFLIEWFIAYGLLFYSFWTAFTQLIHPSHIKKENYSYNQHEAYPFKSAWHAAYNSQLFV